MDAFEAILTRRSIRKYTGKKVPRELVGDLLKAAFAAPTAKNKQPWHFVVIDDRKILNEVPKFHPYSQMLKEASFAILVCGDEKIQEMNGYLQQDLSAATQNILLAAHAKGLGAVWLGIYPREERVEGMRKLISTPASVLPFALISIGYPDEKVEPSNRYSEERVHRNKW